MEYEEVLFFNAIVEKLNKIEALLTKEEEPKTQTMPQPKPTMQQKMRRPQLQDEIEEME